MLGPFVDEDDGKTAETGLTIAQADVRLSKNGANMAQKNESTSCTHDEIGIYSCPLDTTDTATLGLLDVMIHESGALPVHQTYLVVTANWYDTMASTDQLDVNVTNIEGSDPTDQINAAADAAIETYHLDHLLAADYDPSSKPGTATALLNELVENDGGVSRFTENALENAPGGAVAGAISHTVTINDGTNPISDVDVWITTDQAGTNVIANDETDGSGQATFQLDAGTYYLWAQLAGYNFTNPTEITVS